MAIDSISVDYLTLTAKPNTMEASVLQDVWDAMRPGLEAEGHKLQGCAQLGYDGFKVGTVFIGYSIHGTMFRASGTLAHEAMQVIRGSNVVPHCTRIDLQVTYAFDEDQAEMREEQKRKILAYQAANPGGRHPSLVCIDGNGKGDTIQLGKRSSETYIRVYDKTREQKLAGAPWLWRWEVEFKGRRSQEVFEEGMRAHTLENMAGAIVAGTLISRGVWYPWRAAEVVKLAQLTRPATDAQRKLAWMEKQVKPAVLELIQEGYLNEVLDSLGLSSV